MRCQLLALGGTDGRCEVQKRPIKRALAWAVHHLRRNLRANALLQHPRRHVARAHALAHQGDGLIHQPRQRPHTRKPLAVVGTAGKGHDFGQTVRRLHAGLVGNGLQMLAELLTLDVALQLPLVHVVIKLIR